MCLWRNIFRPNLYNATIVDVFGALGVQDSSAVKIGKFLTEGMCYLVAATELACSRAHTSMLRPCTHMIDRAYMYGERFHEDENGDIGGISAQAIIYLVYFLPTAPTVLFFLGIRMGPSAPMTDWS